jgi:transposase-like protein
MTTAPYYGFWFPKAIIQHVIWLYLRFTLSLRDVEEVLAARGIVVTYETVRVWVARFGPLIAGGSAAGVADRAASGGPHAPRPRPTSSGS